MAAKTQPARGMRDFLPADVRRREYVIRRIKDVYERYGLGFTNFTIRLNHRQVLAGVLEAAGVAADKHGDALVALDKLDKIGREGVAREFAARGIAAEGGEALLGFFENLPALEHAAEFVADGRGESGGEAYNRAALGRLVEFVGEHEAGARGLDELRRIVEYASAYGIADKIKIDPSLARG